jgi:hypothetical protein
LLSDGFTVFSPSESDMKSILLTIALIALGASSEAESAVFRSDTAASIVPGCRSFTRPDSMGDAFEQGQCLGLLKGLYYLSSGACVPAAVTVGVLAGTVVRYIDDRPSRLDEDFRELALEALRHAWPCSGARNINFAETPRGMRIWNYAYTGALITKGVSDDVQAHGSDIDPHDVSRAFWRACAG